MRERSASRRCSWPRSCRVRPTHGEPRYKPSMRFLLPLVILTAACSSSSNHATTKPEPVRPSSTGALTEEEFKALHAPPTAGPEKLDGKEIELKGTKAYLSLPKGEGPFPAI